MTGLPPTDDARTCVHCATEIRSGGRFCGSCGKAADQERATSIDGDVRCETCGAAYPNSYRFCKIDGGKLHPDVGNRINSRGTSTGRRKRAPATSPTPAFDSWSGERAAAALRVAILRLHQWQAPRNLAGNAGWRAIRAFGARYWPLLLITAVLVPAALAKIPLLALILLTALVPAWIVALTRSEAALNTVQGFDRRFLRGLQAARTGGRFRRFVIRPFFALADYWNGCVKAVPDLHVFAALRVFGYIALGIVAALTAAAVIYAAVVAILTLLMVAVALTILGWMLDVDTPKPWRSGRVLGRRDPLMGGGRRGADIHRGKGGWFGHEEKAGRIDEDGNIYEGRGGWFGREEKIGRVDDDGMIYEGKGGWFGTERKVGRRDKDGVVYEGEGGWFGTEEKIGRVDKDGTIYEGKGGWFGSEEKAGRYGP